MELKPLVIRWQRLVVNDATCPRCTDTGESVQEAIRQLESALLPLRMRPVLEMQEIDSSTFAADPLESNRIWIAGKSLEEWVGGTTGSSRCCNECGDADCRTTEIDGQTFEAIPAELIVRAALIAALSVLSSGT